MSLIFYFILNPHSTSSLLLEINLKNHPFKVKKDFENSVTVENSQEREIVRKSITTWLITQFEDITLF